MNRLKTYLQISDLHFGDRLQQSAFDSWARYVPGLNGYVGHSHAALGYLTTAFKTLRRAEPDSELIVTGDLTAYGKDSQFQLADSFLSTAGKRPPFLGLNAPGWKDLAISGNHDYWPGFPPFRSLGKSNSAVRTYFPDDWSVTTSTTLPNGVSVVFLRLNSDADVKGWSAERFYACGSFVNAVKGLDKDLSKRPQQNEIRVLLLHHSAEYRGQQIQISPTRLLPFRVSIHLKHLTIDDASQRELVNLIDNHGIRVVLTGHVHNPFFVGHLPKSTSHPQRDVMEARCGSTSQLLTATSGSPIGGGLNIPRYQNSVIVHRLFEEAGQIYWKSEVHALFLSQGKGFQAASKFLSAPAPEDQIVVWP